MRYDSHDNNRSPFDRNKMYHNIIGGGDEASIVVGRLLTTLGFKSKLTGTRYLKDAILYRYFNANKKQVGMTSHAYFEVAISHKTTSTRVERAIRNSILNCYHHGALKSFNVLTQAPIIHEVYAPSNGEFMCSVVNWLQLEKESGHIR